ncbi:hypothetical protein AVEN_24021-1 [Araneus ventricosus]|uniref:Uncharacterized protein n=1 Tax=Araneus ventricosus TaxID=182803 RepID=A0A4Y2D023_ARAVE|nr:hypothetical protein AVEN_24021-1 [Araneus ventricosus]
MTMRNFLPNSICWMALGWMKVGLSEEDAAKQPNLSCSVLHRQWNQLQQDKLQRHFSQVSHALQPHLMVIIWFFQSEEERALLCLTSFLVIFQQHGDEDLSQVHAVRLPTSLAL